ncbi:hypothetical protein POM88_048467 [Heracleum sosnowskyi]|uniref:Uncharacterized protein n=1 Tax=Heracleum sosnowskyi TaxID=360622 RepID=A0AAD8GWE3_9APIA|nr:hypothetical protein POM88_048467 [Heracleum sosnowskyi]
MNRLLPMKRFQTLKKHVSTQACLHPPTHSALHKIPRLLTTPTTPLDPDVPDIELPQYKSKIFVELLVRGQLLGRRRLHVQSDGETVLQIFRKRGSSGLHPIVTFSRLHHREIL